MGKEYDSKSVGPIHQQMFIEFLLRHRRITIDQVLVFQQTLSISLDNYTAINAHNAEWVISKRQGEVLFTLFSKAEKYKIQT